MYVLDSEPRSLLVLNETIDVFDFDIVVSTTRIRGKKRYLYDDIYLIM